MKPLQSSEIGKTGLKVTRLGTGTAPLGGLYADVTLPTAIRTVRRALDLGIRYLDTAPLYGHGKSESYLGEALAGVRRDSFVVSTKVGRLLRPSTRRNAGLFKNSPMFDAYFDYSRDGVLRSIEESLRRLKLDRIDIALIHDPDDHWEPAIREAYPALAELRSRGVIKAIGAGMNQWQMLERFAREGDFDCFLLAGRYTLLDQSALAEFMPLCTSRKISVIIGGPYNSGILASDLSPRARYNYAAAPPEVVAQAKRLKAVCDRHNVPMKAAALQFCMAHPAVASVVPGPRTPAEVEENFNMAQHPIPAAFWKELREAGLIPKDAPVPAAPPASPAPTLPKIFEETRELNTMLPATMPRKSARKPGVKSYALTLNLKDDPKVVAEYICHHAAVWPEVEKGLKDVGVTRMKIYLLGRRLFMYMEAVDSFEPARDFQRYMNSKRAQEWDALMRTYQEAVPEAGPNEWWASMQEVFDLKS